MTSDKDITKIKRVTFFLRHSAVDTGFLVHCLTDVMWKDVKEWAWPEGCVGLHWKNWGKMQRMHSSVVGIGTSEWA